MYNTSSPALVNVQTAFAAFRAAKLRDQAIARSQLAPDVNRLSISIRMGAPQTIGEDGEIITFGQGETIYTYERPWLADYQRDAIFNEARYGVVEASTKSGKTHGCILWITEQAMRGQRGWQYWWVAPIYSQAEIAYRRLKEGLTSGSFKANDTRLSITLNNGTTIAFKSAENPDRLYGEDVHAAVIDEATRVREASWHAIRSTLTATRGPVRIIGNVKGRKNWAYRLARQAESGTPDMHHARITAYDAVKAGILAEAEVEDARNTLPEAVFRELFLAEPSDDGGNPFGLGAIARCILEGGLSSWKPVAWAWDLAKSSDWTVGIGLDEQGRVCRFERWNMTALPPGAVGDYWEITEARIVEVTAGVPALIESNGVGDPVVEGVQRRARSKGQQNFEAFFTSSTSKQQIMEGLAVAVQQHQVGLPDRANVTGIPLVDEMEEFEYELTRTGVRYSAPEGLHDDAVMALAMCWALFDATPTPEGRYIYDQRVSISPF